MILTVHPVERLKGSLKLPASKSYSIRAFLTAACGGNSTIIDPSDCDDAVVAKDVARGLGARIVQNKDRFLVRAQHNYLDSASIPVGESGTVLRLLLPLLSLHVRKGKVTGKGTLIGRPNQHLLETLRANGMDIAGSGPKESVPIDYRGGTLGGGVLKIDGSLSSQFISALLMTAPRLPVDSTVIITGATVVSKDYITMTRQILKKAGVTVQQKNVRSYFVKGRQTFKGLKDFKVPSDYGLAAFFMVAASILPSDIVLKGNLDDALIQSDGHIVQLLTKMGAKFAKTKQSMVFQGPFALKGGTFSLKDCPDLVPIMAVAAMFARGRTRLTDIHHARAKESDRISDLRKELLKVGARIFEKPNELIIEPCPQYRSDVLLDPHHDHRLAMAFSILGLKIGTRVKDVECSHKSYPQFVSDLKKLKLPVKIS